MAKILIMDDEPGLRNVVFGMLKPTGHTLFVTEDGNQAIATAQKENPDLALLDMRVPDMDGLEVVAKLKEMNPRIQCIMLSGFGDVESAVSAMKQGAFDYISKPFKLEEVLRVVGKALATPGAAAPGTAAPSPASAVSAPSAARGKVLDAPKAYAPKSKSKAALFFGLGLAALGLTGFLGWKFLGGSSAPETFSVPYSAASALAWDGGNLWVADWSSQSIYKHTPAKGLPIQGVSNLIENHPTGLAWDGTRLWSCSSMEKKITKHAMDSGLTALVSYPNPLQEPTALAWDGVYLWCADGAGGKLYKLRSTEEGLSIAGTYDGAATNPVGMYFYQGSLWVADGDAGKIYQQDPNTLSVQAIYTLEPYAGKTDRISGMTFDGKDIWTCGQKSGKVYRHSTAHLKKISL